MSKVNKKKVDMKKVLIVDDDKMFRELCEEISSEMGLKPYGARDGMEALTQMDNHNFVLSLIDLKMPRMGGLDLLRHCREIAPGLPVIIITAYGSIETAVEAMKLGAVDYLVKPSSIEEIRQTMRRILESWQESWNFTFKKGDMGRFGILGRSRAMLPVYERIDKMRNSDNTVLITGESGVGKELVAKAIHNFGERAQEPFIPIDCSVLNLSIVESELFGYLKGAFTDAHNDKIGLLKLAGRGTVFFDEITEIPLHVQAKLLRVIQEREIRPVGGSKVEKIEARIIAATNRELEKAVKEGKFREDLFYRLHVIPVSVPPLRERREDIPILVDHFIKKYSTERKTIFGASPEALQTLIEYNWNGNVRELENVIQQAMALGSSEWIRPVDLPTQIRHSSKISESVSSGIKPLKELEKEAIREALRFTGGNKQEASVLLGIGKTTLYEKIKSYGLENLNES
jgi:DNA-binding NtrC family response regulator